MSKTKKPRIVYIINHASFFVSHRLELFLSSKKLLDADPYLIIGKAGSDKMEKFALRTLKKKKIKYFQTSFVSSNNGLFLDFLALFQIIKICKQIKPDIIHSASPKANFLAGLVSFVINLKLYVCSISGMGYLFTGKNLSFYEKILKIIFETYLKILKSKKNICFILQNNFDYELFKKKFGKKKSVLIPSSGINLKKFKFKKKKSNLIIMPSRILYDKGVVDYLKAAIIIKKNYKNWIFKLIGAEDYNNPSAIPKRKLNEWKNKGLLDWESYTSKMKYIYQSASIVCLPSHREGFSKVILEAGASSLPIVASNIPGCKQGIIDSKTGLLFKVKDHLDLAKKLEKLIKNKKLRNKLGKNANKFVKKNYDINKVNKEIIDLYKRSYE